MNLTGKILSIALTLPLAGCSNPLNYRVSQLTRDETAALHAVLTADQSDELDAWIRRHKAAGVTLPAAVTVDAALRDQEGWLAEQRAEKAAAEAVVQRKVAAHAARQQEFARLVSVTLLSKTNEVLRDERHYVAMELQFSNKTAKSIQEVKGILRLVNVYGEPVIDIDWTYKQPIPSQQTVIERDVSIFIDRSVGPQVALWNNDFDKLKFTFDATVVLFKDGTKFSET